MNRPEPTPANIDLLRRTMDKTGTNANKLAKELGRDSSYIYNLLSGKKRSIAARDALKLERLLRLPSGALFDNAVHREERSKASVKKSTVEIDLSRSVAQRLAREATLLGVTPEDLVKVWIGEKMRSIDVENRLANPRRSVKTAQMPPDLRDLAIEALDQPYDR